MRKLAQRLCGAFTWLALLLRRLFPWLALGFRYLFSWLALIWPVSFLRAALRRPAFRELGAPLFPVLALSAASRVAAGWDPPHPDWTFVPFAVLYGLWNIALASLAALGCARLARGRARAGARQDNIALAICGVYACVPWSALMGTSRLQGALGAAGRGSEGPWPLWRDWVQWALSERPQPPWMMSPTNHTFWLCVGPGLALTALGLWRALPHVPRGVRARFWLLWALALTVLVGLFFGAF